MNPRDYDLNELQGASPGPPGAEDASDRTRDRPLRPDDVVRSNQLRELHLLESASTGDLSKPYLETLPESYAAELTLFEWLEYLMSQGGIRGTIDALQYYESVGWLTRDVQDQLQDYLRSLEDPDGEVDDLDRNDHALSLVYVARLSAMTD